MHLLDVRGALSLLMVVAACRWLSVVIVVVLGGARAGGSFRLQRAWLERDNLLLGGVNMAAEVPGNVSAFG